ncbi:Pof6 interacting protein Sip1 [Schizosaccharomyces cryophilus OY26]|uniref:Pof6 interacting protein Sip1 n=1 Tax=Schizosaccharomyces cryophilus (strain OY26 / ATCC MYA-4695 / CBS 11777 / NBRC 106824 / NRRL Y48691) TaxID=653667 RepID=S9VT27_SCHCR|nr:Pof6 interacting protein Sip1 [Schizosaccharomyces cryophilus OY26]EPY49285.1 Pof6 interacting protein Sip1 [Schizosaccharomyces cryophilus OY26]
MSTAPLSLENLEKVAGLNKREVIYIKLLDYEQELQRLSKTFRESSLQSFIDPIHALIKQYGSYIGYPTRYLLSNCVIALLKGFEGYQINRVLVGFVDNIIDKKDNVEILNNLSVLGNCLQAYGQTINQQETFVKVFLKYSKNNYPHGLRVCALQGLSENIRHAGSHLSEELLKEIWKSIKSNLGSSSLNVVLSALNCSYILLLNSSLRNSDLEWLKSYLLKKCSIENSDLQSMLAKCFTASTMLQAHRQIEALKAASGSSAADDENNEESENAQKIQRVDESDEFSKVLQMLLGLYNHKYAKSETPRGVITLAIKHFFLLQDFPKIRTYYSEILSVLLDSTVNPPLSEWLSALEQQHFTFLLHDVINSRFLDQGSEVQAFELLLSKVLEPFVADQTKVSITLVQVAFASIADILAKLKGSITPHHTQFLRLLFDSISLGNDSLKNSAAWCLRCLLIVMPGPIMPTLLSLLGKLENELKLMRSKTKESKIKPNNGILNNLTLALVSCYVAAEKNPLYVSSFIFSKLFNFSLDLIRSSTSLDLFTAQAQLKVGWRLMTTYVSFGPSFTRMQLSQLFILWKNALPRISSNIHSQNFMESNADLFTRYEALQCLLAFLKYNRVLLTPDVRKRIILFLTNCLKFYKSFVLTKKLELQTAIHYSDYSHSELRTLLLSKVFQCFLELTNINGVTLDDQELLSTTVSIIAELSYLQYLDDDSQQRNYSLKVIPGLFSSYYPKKSDDGNDITVGPMPYLIGDPTADMLFLFSESDNFSFPFVPPLATAVVDSAVILFSLIFCYQPPKVMESTLEILIASVCNPSNTRDISREKAISTNVLFSIHGALKVFCVKKLSLSSKVVSLVIELLDIYSGTDDMTVIRLFSESYSFLALLYHNKPTFVLDVLIQRAAESGNPNCRATSIMGVGHTLAKLGSGVSQALLVRAYQLLKVFNADSNDTVRNCSIEASFVSLGTIAKTIPSVLTGQMRILLNYMISADVDIDMLLLKRKTDLVYPTHLFIEYLDCLINELGPTLRSNSYDSYLAYNISRELLRFAGEDSNNITRVYKCYQHLYLFTPLDLNSGVFIDVIFRNIVDVKHPLIRDSAIEVLYQILLQNQSFSESCYKRHLDKLIWQSIDATPENKFLRNIVHMWFKDFKESDISWWVNILLYLNGVKGNFNFERSFGDETNHNLDEDTVSLAHSLVSTAGNKNYRWQTQLFASSILNTCIFDIMSSKAEASHYLISRISDLVRVAFILSTSDNFFLKESGLKLLDTLIMNFQTVKDPDFEDVPLLDQFQAQISSAFTSAITEEFAPEIVSLALNIGANFIGTGLLPTASQANRVVNMLKYALDTSFFENGNENNKQFQNDSIYVLRVTTLSAWAILYGYSHKIEYLKELVSPYLRRFAAHWVVTLRGYSRLRFGPSLLKDFVADTSFSHSQNINPKILLDIYEATWLNIAEALTLLLDENPDLVYGILNGEELTLSGEDIFFHDNINYISDKHSFNFFIFSVCFQSLLIPSTLQKFEKPVLRIMKIMTSILTEDLCTNVLYDTNVFPEVIDLLIRLILTEDWETKTSIVLFVKRLALVNPGHSKLKVCESDSVTSLEPSVSEGVEQLFDLVKILILALTVRLPGLRSNSVYSAGNEKSSHFIILCFDSFLELANIFPTIVRVDLFATALHVYEVILDDPSLLKYSKHELLGVLRKLLSTMVTQDNSICSTLCYTLFEHLYSMLENKYQSESTDKKEIILLSMVLVLTIAAPLLDGEQLIIQNFVTSLFDLLKTTEDFQTATKCTSSLLLANSKHNTMNALCRKIIVDSVAMLQKNEILQSGRYLESFLPSLLSMYQYIDETKKPSYINLALPIIGHFGVLIEKPEVRKKVGNLLLNLMSKEPETTKDILQQVTNAQRKCIEDFVMQTQLE